MFVELGSELTQKGLELLCEELSTAFMLNSVLRLTFSVLDDPHVEYFKVCVVEQLEEAPQPSKEVRSPCIIATVAFGSELAPEVQFLRDFRDHIAMRTLAGRAFMDVFHSWYYLWSPHVAEWLRGNELGKMVVRDLLKPLLWSLHVATEAYSVLSFNPELAIIATGLIASMLIGLAYATPLAIIVKLTKLGGKVHSKVSMFKLLSLTWSTSFTTTLISIMLNSYIIAVVSTPLLVLSTIGLTAKVTTHLLTHLVSKLL